MSGEQRLERLRERERRLERPSGSSLQAAAGLQEEEEGTVAAARRRAEDEENGRRRGRAADSGGVDSAELLKEKVNNRKRKVRVFSFDSFDF